MLHSCFLNTKTPAVVDAGGDPYRAARVVNSSRWGRLCMKVEMLVTSCMARGRGLEPVGPGASTACCRASTTTCTDPHTHNVDLSDTRGFIAGQCVTTETLTRDLTLGVDDDKCIWALQIFNDDVYIWRCNIDKHLERCRDEPGRGNIQRCCCVPRHVVCRTAKFSNSAVDLAKHSWSEH